MIKLFNFFMLLWEVITMKRRKHKLSALMQIYIEVFALDISLKAKTIDDIPNHPVLRELVLEDCKIDYNCNGYGETLVSSEQGK